MAMLAGPRRKQKVINLRAKNSEWSNDTNKFGQRMLEKMGWSSGKGLGAKENGMVEHVVARYKNDEKGLGFEDKNDQWTKHEDDFNALLSNLSNGDNNEEKLHSGVSLEVKSKKSKARVHYHKFTRGKDITRYSEKDLANIFGKRSFKNEEKAEEILNEDIKTTEQVFTEKGSMADYFKNKLAAIKSKMSISYDCSIGKDDYEADYSFQGFSGTANVDADTEGQDIGFQSFSVYNSKSKESNEEICDIPDVETKKSKKKKKSKKNLDDQIIPDIEISENTHVVEDLEHENTTLNSEPIKKKKSKKKKKQEAETVDPEDEVETKQKTSKTEISHTAEELEEDYYVPKKKKKRKNKDE